MATKNRVLLCCGVLLVLGVVVLTLSSPPEAIPSMTTDPTLPFDATATAAVPGTTAGHPVVYDFKIEAEYPHDQGAFLQGLIYARGRLFESTGMYGESEVREVELKTGRVIRKTPIGNEHFGEGLTEWDGKLLQLTWRSSRGFVFDPNTLKQVSQFDHANNDGWGLTHDGRHLIATDSGTDLIFLEPTTYAQVRRVTVRDAETPIQMVNELEFIGGEVYANIFGSDCIARINPSTGKVQGWIVLNDILARVGKQVSNPRTDNVLNGIAWNNDTKRLILSGKRWPSTFEVTLEPHSRVDLATARAHCIPQRNIFQ